MCQLEWPQGLRERDLCQKVELAGNVLHPHEVIALVDEETLWKNGGGETNFVL